MSNKDQDKGFPEKLLKKLPTGVAEDFEKLNELELKSQIITAEKNIYTINQEQENDQKLNGAKEIAKELSAPYKDAKSAQSAKIQYALYLLEGKGVDFTREDDAN
jgi:hypothetical protein